MTLDGRQQNDPKDVTKEVYYFVHVFFQKVFFCHRSFPTQGSWTWKLKSVPFKDKMHPSKFNMEAGNDGNPIGISFGTKGPFSGSMFVLGVVYFFFQSHHFEPLYDIEILGL